MAVRTPEELDPERDLEMLRTAGDHPLVTSFPDGAMFCFDRELRYLSAGGLGLAAVGLSREAMEGRTIFEVFPPETATAIEPLYRSALAGESTQVDIPYEGRVYAQRLAPVRGHDGSIVAGIGFTQDVTQARAAEHELRQSHQRIRLTFDHAPIGQAIVELDGRWREVNAAVCSLLGYSAQQLATMTFQDVTHPDDLEKDLALLEKLVAGEIGSYQIEKRYFTATGRTVWVQLAVALVRDEDGSPEYFIAQIQDTTDRKKQTEALQDLVGMLAHDLRTPASLIDGFASVLADLGDDATPEEVQNYLQRIRSAARAMNTLLDNAMTASRSEAGQLEPAPEQVDLAAFVQDLLAELHPHSEGISVEVDQETSVWMDRGHLGQVLTNLLTNAVKYGGGTVRLVAEGAGNEVVLSVIDDGPGVEAEFVPHLFDRFTRSQSARTGENRGSGLGLFIVKDLTELNGGKVTYRHAPGGGAQFVLRLPLGAEGVAA